MNKPKSILVAIPSYTGNIPLKVISRLMHLDLPEGFIARFAYAERCFIDDARNGIAQQLLNHDDDYLFFCDDDQIPDRDILTKLIELDKDIIGTPIPNRRGEKQIAVFNKKYNQMTEFKGTKEVGAIGMGSTLIKREVIEKMLKKWKAIFYFDVVKEKNIFVKYSEDVTFCRKAREMKFEVWCTDKCKSIHLGDQAEYWYTKGEYKVSCNGL